MDYLTLDGSIEFQIAALKDWFGLSPDQSFQDLDVKDWDEE